VGNYAEVTLNGGVIEVSTFGRRSDLQAVASAGRARCDERPPELLRWYARFGFTTGPAGSVGPGVWANVTMTAHFPPVAERRLLLWSGSDDEVALLDRTGLLGAMPDLGPDGGFSVAATNASGNKIEIFLERDVEVCRESGGGWNGYQRLVDLAPRGSAVFRLVFSVPTAKSGHEGIDGTPVVWAQPGVEC
jgi:hypothetical protein